MAQLGPQDLQTLYQKLLSKGLSPRSVQLTHVIIHRALKQAERWGLIATNPARLVDAPQPTPPEIQPLNPDEITTLLKTAAGSPHEALYVLTLTTGLRQGELLGLRWRDLDLDGSLLHVRQQAQRTPEGWTFVPPKTAKGRRSVTLPSFAVEVLKRHRIRQNEQRLACGPLWEDLDLVFTNELGRPIERQNLVRRSFNPLLEEAGLRRVRFHDLRHSAATWLFSEGVHPKVVQERLGHANISITLDTYSHILPSLQKDAAEKIDRFMDAN